MKGGLKKLMECNINELEFELRKKELEDKKNEKEYKKLLELRKMPFHLRIQEESMKKQLDSVYKTLKNSFEKICKKDKIHKDDWLEEFYLFWSGYLKGEYKSINEYLGRKQP
jgi:hypothetical protein